MKKRDFYDKLCNQVHYGILRECIYFAILQMFCKLTNQIMCEISASAFLVKNYFPKRFFPNLKKICTVASLTQTCEMPHFQWLQSSNLFLSIFKVLLGHKAKNRDLIFPFFLKYGEIAPCCC